MSCRCCRVSGCESVLMVTGPKHAQPILQRTGAMKTIYEREIAVAKAVESDAERLSYLGSVLRSMMQALAIVSLEAVRELTPYSAHEANLTQLVLRFGQPSEGLYGEILEATIPIVRSH